MFELFYIAFALLGSAVAGWIDLKTTDIPDKITFSMIGIGLGLHAIESFLSGTFNPFIISFEVSAGFGIFGYFMYKAGFWGGGDGALLTGIGALVPVYLGIGVKPILPFALAFLFNVFFVGVFYSIAYMIFLGLKNKKIKKQFHQKIKNDFISVGGLILAAVILAVNYGNREFFLIFLPISFILIIPFLYKFTRIVENSFQKKIKVSQLKEDDMLGEDIPKLKLYKRELKGLTKRDIVKIKKLKKTIIIREGIRYGPVFFLALLFTLFIGDFLMLFSL